METMLAVLSGKMSPMAPSGGRMVEADRTDRKSQLHQESVRCFVVAPVCLHFDFLHSGGRDLGNVELTNDIGLTSLSV